MKIKKGFTLAEVIIAVGIIGVIAALMASAFNHVKPDKTKFMYLKAYDTLCEVVIKMGESSSLFKTTSFQPIGDESSEVEVDITNVPFMDITPPNSQLLATISNDDYFKFAKLLKGALNGEDKENTDGYISFTSGPGNYTWTITPTTYQFDDKKAGFANEVKLKIGNEDEFKFCVQADGEIQVLDDTTGVNRNRGLTYIYNRRKPKSENDTAEFNGISSCTPTLYCVEKDNDNYYVKDEVYREPES